MEENVIDDRIHLIENNNNSKKVRKIRLNSTLFDLKDEEKMLNENEDFDIEFNNTLSKKHRKPIYKRIKKGVKKVKKSITSIKNLNLRNLSDNEDDKIQWKDTSSLRASSKKKLKYLTISSPVVKRKRRKNYIKTTKYTFITFLPFNLFQQLCKLSNLYFIFIMILSLIPGISPIFPITSITPVIFILSVSLIKDGIEDLARLRADIKANSKKVWVYDFKRKKFVKKKTSNICVGDYILLEDNKEVPCDLLILYSPKKESECFVTTANLDGETNLKKRNGIVDDIGEIKSNNEMEEKKSEEDEEEKSKEELKFRREILEEIFEKRRYEVECEENTEMLDQMNGKVTIFMNEMDEEEVDEEKIYESDSEDLENSSDGSDSEDDDDGGSRTESERSENSIDDFVDLEKISNGSGNKDDDGGSTTESERNEDIIEKEYVIEEINEGGKELEDSKTRHVEGEERSKPNVKGVSVKNVILRGTRLRNSEFIYGMSMFIGKKTKLFLNLKKTRTKWGRLDKRMNYHILTLLVLQQIMIIIGIAAAWIFYSLIGEDSFYISLVPTFSTSDWYFPIQNWATFLILIEVMIPMSLFVTLEIVKSGQAKLMERKVKHRYYDKLDQKWKNKKMIAKTSNLNFDLAFIDIIFSDKTGTLTENKMKYNRCYICKNELFVKSNDIYGEAVIKKKEIIRKNSEPSINVNENEEIRKEKVRKAKKEKKYVKLFMLNLLLNNSVSPSYNAEKERIVYNGASTDEVALIKECCTDSRFVLVDKTNNIVKVILGDKEEKYEIFSELAFTSKRKRSSVIVRRINEDKKDKKYPHLLLCKGADNELIKRSKETTKLEIQEQISKNVDEFSVCGFRTLVMAYRELGDKEFHDYSERVEKTNDNLATQAEELEVLYDEIEQGFKGLGCTGISDELQEGVPETIDFLLSTGIQIFVLTGDKTETAVNICYTSNVIKKGIYAEIMMTGKSYGLNVKLMYYRLKKIIEYFEDNSVEKHKKHALILDYVSLSDIMSNRTFKKIFIEIIKYCDSTICCRVTPLQKAIMTKLVQKKLKLRGLSVGDGANDVPMIQRAYVGVGIMGNEGNQAARASDFAIPKFKYLIDLLAVEGRYCYLRSSECVLVSFYKNFMYIFISYTFLFFNAISGTLIFDSWVYQVYNTLFHGLPPILFGFLEKDMRDENARKSPELYTLLKKKNPYFSWKNLLYWYLLSIFQCLVHFFSCYAVAVRSALLGGHVTTDDIYLYGHIIMTGMMISMYITYSIHTKHWTVFHPISYILSLIVFVIFVTADSCFTSFIGISTFYFIALVVYDKLYFYMLILFNVTLSTLPVFLVRYVILKWFPSDAEKVKLVCRKTQKLIDRGKMDLETEKKIIRKSLKIDDN